jgi:hypothetical protein
MIEQIVLVSVVGILVIYGLYDTYSLNTHKKYTLMNEMPKIVDKKRELSRDIL